MCCPNAAGTITSSTVLEVSITDRSVALPTAVPDVLPFCEHFMARHILCFRITDKFVLSLSAWPPRDTLNDVAQLRGLALAQSNLKGRRAILARVCENTVQGACTHTLSQVNRIGVFFGGEGRWVGFIFMSAIFSPNTLLWFITDSVPLLSRL